MRVVADVDTGELMEVVDGDLIGGQPYDYADFRRASMMVRRQHKAAIDRSKATGEILAEAEKEYRRQLVLVMPGMKEEYGATNAEQMAKGQPAVLAAKEALQIAEVNDRAAMEEVRLVKADRESAQAMGYWSREAGADGWAK